MFSLTQAKDAAIAVGLTEEQAEEFWAFYAAQGWLFSNGLPVKNLTAALMRWRNNQHRFTKGKKKDKIRLFPIQGKNCAKCGLPAVYKSASGEYDTYYCGKCMPDRVKEVYSV